MTLEKPLEIAIEGRFAPFQPDMADRIAGLFTDDDRIDAVVKGSVVALSCIWHADLDRARQIVGSQIPFELRWGEPRIIYRFETVIAAGRTKEIVLEPVLTVDARTPTEYVGNVIGDLSSRRGLVKGQQEEPDQTLQVRAEVPLSEMAGYLRCLSEMTGGRGSAAATFLRYQERPDFPQPPWDEPMSAALRA